MPKPCSVCSHEKLEEIDRSLLADVPYRTLAAQYGLSASALCRHTKYLARYRQNIQIYEDRKYNLAMLDKLELIEVRLDRIFKTAENFRSLRVALDCLKDIPGSWPPRKNSGSAKPFLCALASLRETPFCMSYLMPLSAFAPLRETFLYRNTRGPHPETSGILAASSEPPAEASGTISAPCDKRICRMRPKCADDKHNMLISPYNFLFPHRHRAIF